MSVISKPKILYSKIPQAVAVENEEQRVLLLGQMISGTATAGELTTNVGTAKEEDALFGAKSQIAGMARSFREVNGKTRLDAIPLADNGSTTATAVVTFTGTTATEDGTITINVGSRKKHNYELAITSADTITEIGDLLVTAITADTNAPFTAVNSSGAVTITASNAGTEANSFGIEYTGLVAGVTTTLTGWTGGATDPVLTGVFDVIGTERYQHIIYPAGYGYDFMEDFLDARWDIDNEIQDGQAYACTTDTVANNTLLSNMSLNDTAKGWTADEMDELNELGFSVIGNNTANNNVITGTAQTMYKTDVAGNPDPTFSTLNAVLVTSNIAEYIFNNLKSDLAQIRLTDGATAQNRAIADSGFIKNLLLSYYDTLSDVNGDYLLMQGGDEQRKIFANNLNIEISLLQGRVTITNKANIISQIREILITTEFGYSAE